MAYRDDVIALGPDHGYPLDGDANDIVGTDNGNGVSFGFAGTALTEDATNSSISNAIGDSIDFPSVATINNAARTRHAVCGWVQISAIQPPPKRLYGEGNATTAFQFVLAYGNNVFLEVTDPGFNVQVFSDRTLQPGRTYHLCGVFEGSGFANEVRFYLDGVKQLVADPSDAAPDDTELASRGQATIGDPTGGEGVGNVTVILNSPVNGNFQHWYIFNDTNAVLTDTEIREELFEKGALPDTTISTDTEANMQTDLDTLSGTTTDDAPLNIRVEAVSGGGDLELTADDITFNDLASIHVQYMGTDTLDWVNTNGSNGSIGSTPNGGTINFINPVTVRLTVRDATDSSVIEGARVLLEADTGGPLAAGTDILSGLTNASGVIEDTAFRYSSDQPVTGRVRRGTTTPLYKTALIVQTITSSGLDITVLMVGDE